MNALVVDMGGTHVKILATGQSEPRQLVFGPTRTAERWCPDSKSSRRTRRAQVAVEQASTLGWERYVRTSGRVIGMKTFGASAPLKKLQRKFGFDPDRLVAAANEQLRNKSLSENRRGLDDFAESSEQNVPAPFSQAVFG